MQYKFRLTMREVKGRNVDSNVSTVVNIGCDIQTISNIMVKLQDGL